VSGCTVRTGGTPVPLRWNRRGRRNLICLSACRAREWLNTYAQGEGIRGEVCLESILRSPP